LKQSFVKNGKSGNTNTGVIENADSKTQVLDLIQDVAYVVPGGRHLIGDPNFLRIDKTTMKYDIKNNRPNGVLRIIR